jgi:tRNA(Ile)-lysidine synthase
MLEKFQKHIASNFPFLKGKKLLIAISGGVDSVVLTQLFVSLNEVEVSLAHCNFKLRDAASDQDESFVKELGNELQIQTFTKSFNTNAYASEQKVSTQVAARELRYKWFNELLSKYGFDYIATAHHADDNLETFLINLTRGSGLDGLTGIPTINKNVIRPILDFSRVEIEDFAKDKHLKWREDESNASTKYVRNKIRHHVIPVLKEINPSLLDSFQKTTSNLQGSQHIIDQTIEDLKIKIVTIENDVATIDLSEFHQLSNQKAYLFELLKAYGFTEWNDVSNLITAQSGKFVLSKTHRILKNRDTLVITKIEPQQVSEYYIHQYDTIVSNPIQLEIKNLDKVFETDKYSIILDKDKLTFPLTIRKRKDGDYFYPSGMQGKKKVSKYFKDEKFSLLDKENTWLLCSNQDIVWVIGHRLDNRYLPKNNAHSLMKIQLL